LRFAGWPVQQNGRAAKPLRVPLDTPAGALGNVLFTKPVLCEKNTTNQKVRDAAR
jgi:hypothetical protein